VRICAVGWSQADLFLLFNVYDTGVFGMGRFWGFHGPSTNTELNSFSSLSHIPYLLANRQLDNFRVESDQKHVLPLTPSHSDHDRLVLPIAIAVTQSFAQQPRQISDIVTFGFFLAWEMMLGR